jgi:hypothetical protein
MYGELLRESDIGAVRQRLNRLTHYEALVTAKQILEVIYDLVKNVTIVMKGAQTLLFNCIHGSKRISVRWKCVRGGDKTSSKYVYRVLYVCWR